MAGTWLATGLPTAQPLARATLPRSSPPFGQRSAAFQRALDGAARSAGAAPSRAGPAASRGGLRRIDQTNPAEYENGAQARVWSGSTCSAASVTALLRSRGVGARIADVMKAMPGGMTPELGLISRPALMQAAARFGLQTRDDVTSYESLQSATAAGKAVLVDVRNQRFPEGHWLVVTGADARGVNVVDSSGFNLTWLPRDEFTRSWSGRGIRVVN